LGSPELDPTLQICITRAEQRRRITSLQPVGDDLPNADQDAVGLPCVKEVKDTLLAHVQLAAQILKCKAFSTLYFCIYYASPSAVFGISL